MNPLAIPYPIEQRLDELYIMVEANPIYIPLTKVAAFLGADDDGLRDSIDKGQCPFALGWQKTAKGNRAYKIPTVPFYLWYTQGVGFRH